MPYRHVGVSLRDDSPSPAKERGPGVRSTNILTNNLVFIYSDENQGSVSHIFYRRYL